MMVNWVHTIFLQPKDTSSKGYNTNWWQDMNGHFYNEYWEAACKEIKMLEVIESWEVVDIT